MNREQKAQKIQDLNKRLDRAELLVLTDFTGLDVSQMTELRAALRQAEAEYEVAKNTLIRLAARKTPAEKLAEHFTGPNGLTLAYEDIIKPAKVLSEFAKKHEQLTLKAGILKGEVIGPAEIKRLAALPGRDELLAQLLGALNAGPTNLVGVLAGVIRGFLGALKAIETQKAEAAA